MKLRTYRVSINFCTCSRNARS